MCSENPIRKRDLSSERAHEAWGEEIKKDRWAGWSMYLSQCSSLMASLFSFPFWMGEIEPRASHMLEMHFASELDPCPYKYFSTNKFSQYYHLHESILY